MGANIPLPALDVHQQPPIDPLAQIKNVLALRNVQQEQQTHQLQQTALSQENQQRDIQLKQTQKQLELAPQFVQKDDSGKVTGYDHEAYFNALLGAGVMKPQDVYAAKANIADSAKKISEAGSAGIDLQNKKIDQASQLLEGIRTLAKQPGVTPQQLQDAYSQALPQVRSLGIDISKYPATYPGEAGLVQFETGIGATRQLLANAKEIAQTKEAGAKTGEAEASTTKTNLENDALKQFGGMTKEMQESKYIHLQQVSKMGGPVSPEDKAFMWAFEKDKTLVPAATFSLQNAGATGSNGQPSAIAQGLASGAMKWQDVVSPRTPMSVKTALFNEVRNLKPDFNTGDFAVEQAVKTEATSGAVGKQLLAIGTAREHMKLFSQLADALDNNDTQVLNKVGNFLGVQFGSDKATNLKIASQAFGGEVGRAFDGAGVIGKEREEASKSFSDYLSKGQFKGAVDTVDALLAGKQKAAHAWFDAGTKAKPDFGQEESAKTPAAASTTAATKTYKGSTYVQQPDGSWKKQ